jgi:hypothetical protein
MIKDLMWDSKQFFVKFITIFMGGFLVAIKTKCSKIFFLIKGSPLKLFVGIIQCSVTD